ncbi:hypothetical protein [Nakamurella sp.]|uniref:hypothetical protein n=1 Tax=Nakamurella sp. TaxID=1869182 RepID=UPI003B3AD312
MAPLEPAIDPAAARRRHLRWRIAHCWLAGAGLVLAIAGSFLPWVASGSVTRSIYAIAGVADRLGIAGEGVLARLLAALPVLAALCFAPVIAAALRWWRTAGALATSIGLVMSVLALGILALTLGKIGLTVRLDPLGPSVMAAGGLLLVAGGVGLIFGHGSPVRRTEGR